MPAPHTLLVFCGAALVLLVIPGPSVLYIVGRSIDHGRRAGFASVLGVASGSLVHVTAAAAGVSAVLAASAVAFTVVKLLGAGYLVFVGIRELISRVQRDEDEDEVDAVGGPRDLRRFFWQGFVVNTLNPKVALFFLAFLPQFVDPGRGPAALQVVVLGVIFAVLGVLSDGTYAVVAGTLGRRLGHSKRYRRWRQRVTGSITVGLGVSLAGSDA